MSELIHTRIAPPAWLGNQVRRDVLLARIDAALGKRLTLLHAPAGYGKTSLLSQWREQIDARGVRTAWLTLEHEDTDAVRMAQYVALALDVEAEQSLIDLPPRAALSAIISRLAQDTRQVVLIFDDLHRADNPAAIEFLKSLIRLAPANTHFVISSRDYPWLGQSALAAADQLLELTTDDLKFSAEEAGALLDQQVALDEGDVARMMARTEGWPIALQLAALSIKRGADRHTLAEHIGGPSPELARYLSEQVVMALPEGVQDVLLRTAVLDRLTGETVDLLCDRQDGWLVLERLEQQGVVLTPLTADRSAYRYHQLFAEYLRERLARQDRGLFRAMHWRAARFFADRGHVVDAINHALHAGDDTLLADIMEDAGGWRLIPQGLQSAVERGLTALPAGIADTRWRLRLARIYLQIKRGEMAAAQADYDLFTAAPATADLSADAWIEVRVVGDTLADYHNLPVAFDDLLEREALLRTLPSYDHLVLANGMEVLGARYVEGGWLERALEPTLAARDHYRALGSLYSELFTHFGEARIRRAQGRISDAAIILASTQQSIHAAYGKQSDLAANCAAFEAELLFEQDRGSDAMALLDWALPHMEQSDGWVDVYNAAYGTAARATAAGGNLEGARLLLARARRLASRRRLPQLELLATLCEVDILIDHATDLAGARQLAEAIGLDALAETMGHESPRYRPVAVAATLARIKLLLAADDAVGAGDALRQLRRWGKQHGAGRLLVDVSILLAEAYARTGDGMRAQALFDEAVGTAMFQNLKRPFLDLHPFTRNAIDEAVARGGDADRFRNQFLRGLARTISGRTTTPAYLNALNESEVTILRHLSHGLSNKEIARLIGMSPDTVKYRLKSMFRKIGVHNRRDAVRVSRERGFAVDPAAAT
ncbi:LuxR C-terminal-related transcriptional regulator [uncultured Sphingomonas sp.]|uniref:helix-turn-helix transcriptional regulator n=1 Tax=uncultured Sphingomonas sp. TaxID=158754 RepID=UPI0025DF6B93|nr:LuxR C-terminal-related transcriptional regulator [uncultured Sphingomonas sp.]